MSKTSLLHLDGQGLAHDDDPKLILSDIVLQKGAYLLAYGKQLYLMHTHQLLG